MPSTYNNALRIEEIANGEQSGLWGTTTNKNLGQLIVQAVTGTTALNVTAGNITLTALDGIVDEARSAVLAVTGTPGVTRILTIPNVTKLYTVNNATANIVQVKTTSGTAFDCPALSQSYIVCDGANVVTGRSITDGANTITASAAPFNSPTFTGVPIAPTAAPGTNTTQLATTAFVTAAAATKVSSVTATAPVASTGGTTPVISMPAATTSVNGYLTSTDWTTFNNKGSGTVTSVTGTAPVVSSGGNTPAISMPPATTSANGYLTSTDWNTFNGKQSAGTYVNSVSATSPVTSTGGTTPTIAMPAATTSVNGYLTSTDWNTFNNKLSNVNLATQVTGTLPVANGGTGVTTSTGSGANVLGTSPTIADLTISGAGGNVFSSTYTPTLTNVNGIISSTASVCYFTRVGSVVTVSGQITITTNGTGLTQMRMTCPVASNFSSVSQAAGTFNNMNYVSSINGGIYAASASSLEWRLDDSIGGTRIFSFNAAYLVV